MNLVYIQEKHLNYGVSSLTDGELDFLISAYETIIKGMEALQFWEPVNDAKTELGGLVIIRRGRNHVTV
jgi:hypothetical protein